MERKKLVFFSKGDDKFLNDIIVKLSSKYEVKKITITLQALRLIDNWMEWADICWFEWCDELLAYGSNLALSKYKKIICRLHSYEAFTNYPSGVDWSCVDKLIFVSQDIREYVTGKFKVNREITAVIPNGLDMDKYTFKERTAGFNIAYVGYINYKKGPMLLLHTFKAIYDSDSRFKLYIAGQFQDERYSLYFKQMIHEFGLENNFIFEGWQENINQWLEDKNYILCTSILESQNMSVMQAMAKGIKPVIHNFVGATNIYKRKYLWNTINEAVLNIAEESYNSTEYRDFVADNYSLGKALKTIDSLFGDLVNDAGNKLNVNKTVRQEDSCEGRRPSDSSVKDRSPSIDYIRNKIDEFIPYSIEDFNQYDFSTAQIMLGKLERKEGIYQLIEFILNNRWNEKLIINNIWYNKLSGELVLPQQIKKSTRPSEITRLVKGVIENKNLQFENNIAGFIHDLSMKEDVRKNYLAYVWERGIPASQFLPIQGYLKIAERYIFAAGFINKNHRVLEAPCGFGYGAAYLSKICRQVEATDIAKDNITFAKEAFRQQNINWSIGDVTGLSYGDSEFDVYVSCEVFEHLPVETAVKHIEEAYRVLKKSGKFIISTPNREMRRNVNNPFHIKEYSFDEFSAALKSIFRSVEFYSMTDFIVEKGMKESAYNMIGVCEK